jgi:hypothetical protein
MVESLTALTATHVQYGCTAVRICEERMRPLDPLRALAAVRTLLLYFTNKSGVWGAWGVDVTNNG